MIKKPLPWVETRAWHFALHVFLIYPHIFRGRPEDEVEADHGLWLGRPAVVDDRGLGLCPHEAPVLSQEAVVSGAHLPLGHHCGRGL